MKTQNNQNNTENLKSDFYTVPTLNYCRWLLKANSHQRIVVLCASMVASAMVLLILLGFLSDVRFLILALMLLFIVIPMGISFLFILYGFDPINRLNNINHRIEISQNTLNIVIRVKDYHLQEEDPGHTEHDEASSYIEQSYTINYSGISKWDIKSKNVIVWLRGEKQFIIIPIDAFPEPQTFSKLFNFIREHN